MPDGTDQQPTVEPLSAAQLSPDLAGWNGAPGPVPPQAPPPPAWPPAGYPPSPPRLVLPPVAPPPQPKNGRSRLSAVIVGVVVVALLSCGGAVILRALMDKSTRPAAMVGPSMSVPATPAPIASGDGQALLAKMLPVPADGLPEPTGSSGDKVMNLDEFLKELFSGSPQEGGLLVQRRFQVAAERDWRNPDDSEVNIQLIQFGIDAGAQGYVLGQVGAFTLDPEVTAKYEISGASYGSGFEKSAPDSAGLRRALLFAQDGPIAVVILVFTPGNLDRTAEITLLQQQVRALAGP